MFETILSSIGLGFAFLIFFLIFERVFIWFAQFLGFFAIVQEGTCHVYVLFGKVVGVLKEHGLNFLWAKIGLRAFIVRWFGRRHDMCILPFSHRGSVQTPLLQRALSSLLLGMKCSVTKVRVLPWLFLAAAAAASFEFRQESLE